MDCSFAWSAAVGDADCVSYSLSPYFVTGGILLLLLHGDTPAAVMFNTGSRKGPAVSICFIEVLSRDSNTFEAASRSNLFRGDLAAHLAQ